MTDTEVANPYAAFDVYWQAGWRAILPLPYRRKKSPPADFTGYQGREPSYPDCHAWAESYGTQNICLRMTETEVGIDVDHYDGKAGGDTLADLVAKYGPLPPTWMSTSRDDGISGIRFYRVPAGVTLPTNLPGIEFVQRHHRYAVVWPSLHPEGRTYRWIDERNPATGAGVPDRAHLPALPDAWISGLATEAGGHAKADLDEQAAIEVILGLPAGEPCAHVRAGAAHAFDDASRHDSYNEAVIAVVGAGRRGCPGAQPTLKRLRAAFLAEVAADGSRTRGEALSEWRRNIGGAAAIAATEPQGTSCPDDALAWLSDIGALGPAPDTVEPDGEPISDAERAYHDQVAKKAAELRILDAARDINAAAKAADAPPLAGIGLPDFLAQPDEETRYRVDRLWPCEGRTLLVAAAKAGKTTLVSRNLLGALTAGGKFLGEFDVAPVTGTVVYLNLEVGEATMRAWMRKAGIPNADRIVVVNLRGRIGALNLSSAPGRRRFADFLADQGAEVVIADPLAPLLAAHDLVEDSNSDVAKFFAWWSEAMADAGVTDDLIAHHAGHAGQRSRGASRLLDEPDAIWTITKAQAKVDDDDILAADDRRYITAYGRDVELPETGLDFDATTGRLTLADGDPKVLRRKAEHDAYEKAVKDYIESEGGTVNSQRRVIKSGGNESRMKAALERLVASGEVVEQSLGQGLPTIYRLSYPQVSPRATPVAEKWRQVVSPAPLGATPVVGRETAPPGRHLEPTSASLVDIKTCRVHKIDYVTVCPDCDQ